MVEYQVHLENSWPYGNIDFGTECRLTLDTSPSNEWSFKFIAWSEEKIIKVESVTLLADNQLHPKTPMGTIEIGNKSDDRSARFSSIENLETGGLVQY
jgi:hypothetical protein